MDVSKIVEGKDYLVQFLKNNGFSPEADYVDEDYNKGFYFKIDKKKLLVVYEIFDENKLKEVKNHFLIDKGLSYCVIFFNHKVIFYRNFGETKHFIFSERTVSNKSKLDKLSSINKRGIDFLFQSKDISAKFYELFKNKRNILVRHIKNDFEPTQKFLIAQKIFDRIFFIYFLCHKGIIKFVDGGRVSGESLFSGILLGNGDFLYNIKELFRLFNSQKDDILKVGNHEIFVPYLNGGLFRPDVFEQDLDISLSKKQWDDIFVFLNSYHWIIEDIKVSEEDEERILTPEILGHVYERSVVEWEQVGFKEEAETSVKKTSERKKKGVYYTPEPITDYISNNTIIPFLLDKLDNKYDSFDELVDSNNKTDLIKAVKVLSEITVLDPACGSGAFLVKASEILFSLKRRLNYLLKSSDDFYKLKLDIITENIYGVDILSGAIEIAKLRLWLWLISDFDSGKNDIKPLPNIEYNLKVGNSLVGWLDEKLVQIPLKTPLTEKIDGIFIGLSTNPEIDSEEIKKAKTLLEGYKIDDYIEAYYILYKIYRKAHGSNAENLKKILETVKDSIYLTVTPAFLDYVNRQIKPKYNKNSPPINQEQVSNIKIFHWRIDFGHILKGGGFDLIVGNPPYFPITRYKKYEKDILFNTNPELLDGNYVGKIDVFGFFINRFIKGVLKEDKYLSYIIPKTILSNISFSVIRRLLIKNYKISELVDLEKVFSEVTGTMTYLLLFLKKRKQEESYDVKLNSMDLFGDIITSHVNINMLKRPPFFIWVLSKESLELLNKIEKNSSLLKSMFTTKNGVCTGDNSKFLSSIKESNKYQSIFVAKDVSQFDIKKPSHYVLYDRSLLHRPREDWIFKGPKILIQMIRGLNTKFRLISALDKTDTLALNNLNIVRKKDNNSKLIVLLGYLNSKLINYWFKCSITDVNIKTVYLDVIPIKFDKNAFNIEDLVKKLINDPDDINLKNKIDSLIYNVYNLSEKDIQIIESEFK
ncbi:MAG: TaqI-like C-terminal specificity domain-containing protein [Candidatus Nanoarchaeia archaeon]|jgi:hypothetical protein